MFEEVDWDDDKDSNTATNALVKQVLYKGKKKRKHKATKPIGGSPIAQPKRISPPKSMPKRDQSLVSSAIPRVSKLQTKMAKRLSGARFRWINEKLYTSTGDEAMKLFSESPDLFQIYHSGFSEQVTKWPSNPLDGVIDYIKGLPPSYVIADFGCGDAMLAQGVPQRVHSFDLVAVNEHVTACNMANVPLKGSSVDVAVFCLSLMNLETIEFIVEARRVLKVGGILKICEIKSRISSIREFVSKIKACSFSLEGKPRSLNKLFIDFTFTLKDKKKIDLKSTEIHLNPCLYKKR